MSVKEISVSKPEYDQYPLFKKYFKDLKERVEVEKKCVNKDDKNAKMFYVLNPRSELNKRGYPHWDTSKARELLKKDVENKLHKKMTMKEMQQKIGSSGVVEIQTSYHGS
eukprot:scaffold18159_cov58-Cyclotella_meneghiniana.AAC.3